MKIILTFFVLFFSSSVVAEDISDFEIEGISVGDSLLDYMSEDEIKKEIANLSSSNQNTSLAPEVLEKLQSAPDGNLDNTAGLSELKYYIVELMKDQNEIRQIVKDLRELLEKGEEN